MAAKNPVTYAEEELQVHKVFEDARQALVDHQAVSSILDDLKTRKRQNEIDRERREQIVTIEVLGRLDDGLSMAAKERAIKSAITDDVEVMAFKRHADDLATGIMNAESEKHTLSLTVNVLQARMVELGGYLHYLAAAKAAATARSATPAAPPGPWD